ncbi:hypothetical protein NE237_004101 [Protea cynaroides]|uniref:Uncharacterized protein n=1 Tax=Protea cynaroides TaxID=273540 RepID=A0A9Q0KI63_9MAGN|nr:hypothetical protein NE237_004101 [Protea cynaroides]
MILISFVFISSLLAPREIKVSLIDAFFEVNGKETADIPELGFGRVARLTEGGGIGFSLIVVLSVEITSTPGWEVGVGHDGASKDDFKWVLVPSREIEARRECFHPLGKLK